MLTEIQELVVGLLEKFTLNQACKETHDQLTKKFGQGWNIIAGKDYAATGGGVKGRVVQRPGFFCNSAFHFFQNFNFFSKIFICFTKISFFFSKFSFFFEKFSFVLQKFHFSFQNFHFSFQNFHLFYKNFIFLFNIFIFFFKILIFTF